MGGKAGELKDGMAADLTLWDLTSLQLLPHTDPLGQLVFGSRTQAPLAGSTLDSCWVRRLRVIEGGSPCGVDLLRLRELLAAAQPKYCDSAITDPGTRAATVADEIMYRGVNVRNVDQSPRRVLFSSYGTLIPGCSAKGSDKNGRSCCHQRLC